MDYSSLNATAIAQIADKGRAVTLVYKTPGSYDPQTDAITGNGTTSQTVKMVILNFKRKDVDGTLIKTGDRMALLANDALTRPPKTNDNVTDGGETYNIEDVEAVAPGDTVLLYKLQLRK